MSSIPSPNKAWSIGQTILCIDDSFPRGIHDWCDSVPVAGQVYTIRDAQLGPEPTTGHRDVGFLLAEMFNPRTNGKETGLFHPPVSARGSTPMPHVFPQLRNANSKACVKRTGLFNHIRAVCLSSKASSG